MSDSDDDIFGKDEEEDTETVNKKNDDDKDIFGSESENEQNEDFDNNDEEEEKPQANDEDENSDKQNDDNFDENRNEVPSTEPQQEIEYGPPEVLDYHSLPHIQKSAKLYHVRIPNIFGIDPKPFDPSTYEEVKLVDEEGVAKKTHANPETVIRWRYELDSNGIAIRQTNSKFVRWNDGSLGLFIGNELYDVTEHKAGHDHNYLFVRQKRFIQCQGAITSKLTFRPASLVSKSHVKLTSSVLQRHKKERKIKLVHAEIDPDKDKAEKEKIEEDRISSRDNLEAAKQRKRKSFGKGLSAEALEYSDDDGNIGAIKQHYKKNKREAAAEKRLLKTKSGKKKNRYEDEEDFDDYDDDDDYFAPKKRGGKKVASYDDDEEDEDF